MHKHNNFNQIKMFREQRVCADQLTDAVKSWGEQLEQAESIDVPRESLDLLTQGLNEDKTKIQQAIAGNADLKQAGEKIINSIDGLLKMDTTLTREEYQGLEIFIQTETAFFEQEQAITDIQEQKLKIKTEAIGQGWTLAHTTVEDYENPGGILELDYNRPMFPVLRLYGGILAGLAIGAQGDLGLRNTFQGKVQRKEKREGILEQKGIEDLLEGEREEVIAAYEAFEVSPRVINIKGYMTGLMIAAKGVLTQGEMTQYHQALQRKWEKAEPDVLKELGGDYQGSPDRTFKKSLEMAVKILPTPEEWEIQQRLAALEAAPAGGAQAPAAGGARIEIAPAGQGPAAAPASGGKKGAGGIPRRAPSRGPAAAQEWKAERKITATTHGANARLMKKWEQNPEIVAAIRQRLNITADTKWDSPAFASAVQAFQKEKNLDLQDGIMGDQTMTAIINALPDSPESKKAQFGKWGVEERKISHYSGGRFKAPASPPAAAAAAPAATAAVAPAAAPAATPAAAQAAAPESARENLQNIGQKYTSIAQTLLGAHSSLLFSEKQRPGAAKIVAFSLRMQLEEDILSQYDYVERTPALNARFKEFEDKMANQIELNCRSGSGIEALSRTIGLAMERTVQQGDDRGNWYEYLNEEASKAEKVEKLTQKQVADSITEILKELGTEKSMSSFFGKLQTYMERNLKDTHVITDDSKYIIPDVVAKQIEGFWEGTSQNGTVRVNQVVSLVYRELAREKQNARVRILSKMRREKY